MANFETKPRQRVDSAVAKVRNTPMKSPKEVNEDEEEVMLPPVELTRSRTSIIKDIGGPEDTKKLLGLVLLLLAAFLIKKYLDL